MANNSLYKVIYNDLLEQIHSGKIQVGERVKTEKQLSEEYKVSRITSKKALDMLAEQGYIQRRAGFGSVVVSSFKAAAEHRPSAPNKILGVITNSMEGAFLTNLLSSMARHAHERGYNLLIQNSLESPEYECSNLAIMKKIGVRGIILIPCMNKTVSMELMKTIVDGYKIVTINRELVGLPTSMVSSDHRGAVAGMVECLTGFGCKSIGYINNTYQHSSAVKERAKAFETLMLKRGVLSPPMLTITDPNVTAEPLYDFFSKNPELDGVITYNSGFIGDIKNALGKAGRKREGDVAIACFERLDPKLYSGSDVTYVIQPEEEMAAKAVDILIGMVEKEDFDIKKEIIPTTLVKGDFQFNRASLI